MSGSWSNTSTELVIIQAGGTFTGLFVYSPTIGANNLVASIAAQAGTDPYGNPYLQGVAVYTGEGADGNIFMQMDPSIGAWVSGQMKSGSWDQTNAGSIQVLDADPGIGLQIANMTFQTPVNTAFLDGIEAIWSSGAGGQATGSGTNPQMLITDRLGTSAVDQLLSGTVIKTTNNGTAEKWITVGSASAPFATNWTTTTTFNGSGNYGGTLRFRKDAQDNLLFDGIWAAGGTAPATTVFQLPAGYRPKATGRVWIQEASGGVLSSGYGTVDTSGNFNVRTSSGLTLAANATYQCSGFVPLGNIP